MEGLEIYDWLRFILLAFIISLTVIFILLWVQKSSLVNGFTLAIVSVLSIAVSGMDLIIMGYLADELGLAGDAVAFYLFLVIVGLNLVNLFTFFKRAESSVWA